MWIKLLLVIAFFWVLQGFLTVFQIMNFKKKINEFNKYGYVGLGAVKGRLNAGTIVLLAGNQEGEIVEAQFMRGRTVLARFKPYQELIGLKYWDILTQIKAEQNNLLQALERAVNNLEKKYEEDS